MSIQDPKWLIGKREGQDLEFKAADVLKKPTTVAREVVAFLNATGGDVWIGVGEQNGVATSLQGIPMGSAAVGSLWNHLVDTVEPSPLHTEVKIDPVRLDDGGDIIHVKVEKGSRKPYALLKDRGRQFHIRVRDRTRDMAREEIAADFRATPSSGDRVAKAMKDVRDAADKERGSSTFWWCLEPSEPVAINFEHIDTSTRDFFEDLLMKPQASGNRYSGWTMVFDQTRPSFRSSGLSHIVGTESNTHAIEISPEGRMTFKAPRKRLEPAWNDKGTEIFPFAIVELPVSTFRMAGKILGRFARDKTELKVITAAVIGGMEGATLRAGSPQEPSMPPWRPPKTFEGRDLVVPPFEIDGAQIRERPDAAAYRLVLRLYEQFGFDSSDIPPEFDPKDHVLRLPRS